MDTRRVLSIGAAFVMMAALVLAGCGKKASPEADFAITETAWGTEFSGYRGAGGEVVIPKTIHGKRITTIGEGAFDGCTGLRPKIRAAIEKRFGSGVFRE
jgi:hypothetical protein